MSGPAETVAALYNRHAAAWLRDRGLHLHERAWFERFGTLLPPGPVLDLGCGGGEPVAGHFIRQGRAVTGIDAAAAMIEVCRGRFPGQSWLLADMRGLALDRMFAGILAWDSFFHLTPDDQRSMFPIFRRHAGPGAPLLFTAGPAEGEAVGAYAGEPLYHASLSPPEFQALLERHGFTVVDTLLGTPSEPRTIWLARRREDDTVLL